jgi:hypothetical protein
MIEIDVYTGFNFVGFAFGCTAVNALDDFVSFGFYDFNDVGLAGWLGCCPKLIASAF